MIDQQVATREEWQAARSKQEVGLVIVLLALAAAGWVVTADRMSGMDAGPGTDLGSLGWFTGVWVTMMAAMMLPSLSPMVLAHARPPHPPGATSLFVAGYLLPWAAAGVLGYGVVEGLRSLDLGFLGWYEAGRYVAGGVIAGAAVYQLTGVKNLCLRRCRSPRMLLEDWRPGRAGALRMGIAHGGFCVGCCWAMMAALFALGVMSIGWMVFVAALIAVEKLSPWKLPANRGIAMLLVALGIAVAVAPENVPGLTLPGSHDAAPMMKSMG
jgi:predicted metal-binding membrane protein